MRFLSTLPALAILAAALPAPQDIDLEMVAAMPDPTYSEAVGVTAQSITYDATAVAAQATSAVSSVWIEISDVLSSTAVAKRHVDKRTACATQPTGATGYPVASTDAAAWESYSSFVAAATNAATPSGYTKQFTNLNASNNAYGYLGFTTLSTYDTALCASKCNAINGCLSFNLYFERDPSLEPGSGCENPSSVTQIKCVFWGGPVSSSNANNYGQYRSQFQVLVAGSNGYTNNTLLVPAGYSSASYLGNVAINAPYDGQGYNTFMGSRIFNNGVFNASLCAAYCDEQSNYTLANPANDGSPPKVCRFFNTYLLYLNTTAHMQGQYCSLYTEAWTSTYATNSGQYRGNDHYIVEYSYSYTNATSAGVAPKDGDKKGAIYQAAVDMKYDTTSLTSVFQPFCSSMLTLSAPTVTSSVTNIETVVISHTATVTASAVAKRTVSSTPDVLTKYPATVISSACSLIVTSAATVIQTTTVSTSTTSTTTTASTTTVAAATPTVFHLKVNGGTRDGQYLSIADSGAAIPYMTYSDTPVSTFKLNSATGGLYSIDLSLDAAWEVAYDSSDLTSDIWFSPVSDYDYYQVGLLPCTNQDGTLQCGGNDFQWYGCGQGQNRDIEIAVDPDNGCSDTSIYTSISLIPVA